MAPRWTLEVFRRAIRPRPQRVVGEAVSSTERESEFSRFCLALARWQRSALIRSSLNPAAVATAPSPWAPSAQGLRDANGRCPLEALNSRVRVSMLDGTVESGRALVQSSDFEKRAGCSTTINSATATTGGRA